MSERRLERKVALVTGAGSGIGRATALVFAREGARLVLADVDAAAGEATAALAAEGGGEVLHVPCDVSAAAQVDALVEGALERFGRLDCAFNNAGIGGASAPLAEYAEKDWQRVLAVNLTGVFLCMRAELRPMLAQGGGAIVNAASILGVVGYPRTAAYTAAKHGVLGLTRTAAIEYATRGIRVNAVCPAWIETPMVLDEGPAPASDPGIHAALAGIQPMRRLGTPDEVAHAVAWLCSDAASFVSGHPLLVDGAFTAGRERPDQAFLDRA
jgi:NAD(P)-dependent dehydrogenase (short-subunit alcohol dehydrogenase family)